MRAARQGWSMILLLIIMGVLTLMAAQGFRIAFNLFMTARMRYHYHQKLRLAEGLLDYATQVCNENKEILLPWGRQGAQTMVMTFDPWPNSRTVATLGHYSGLVSITSRQGALYLSAQLACNKLAVMTGQAVLRAYDPKNPKSPLIASYWKMSSGS